MAGFWWRLSHSFLTARDGGSFSPDQSFVGSPAYRRRVGHWQNGGQLPARTPFWGGRDGGGRLPGCLGNDDHPGAATGASFLELSPRPLQPVGEGDPAAGTGRGSCDGT